MLRIFRSDFFACLWTYWKDKEVAKKWFKNILECLENFEQELWDEEFEGDVKLGKLDILAEQAIRDFQDGKWKNHQLITTHF